MVDIDELNPEFKYPAYGIIGVSEGSLVVVGDAMVESGMLKSAVVQFKSESTDVIAY